MLFLELAEGVRLRLPEELDAPELVAIVEANRAHLEPWMPWTRGYTGETALAWIRQARRQLADNQGLQCVVEVDGCLAGTVGVHRIDWVQRTTSLGYWLAADVTGRGIVTAAARAYLDHAFRGWGMDRLEIRAGTHNARSRAIPERLGFTFEGVARHAERVGDRVLDHAVYAMLASDWLARAG